MLSGVRKKRFLDADHLHQRLCQGKNSPNFFRIHEKLTFEKLNLHSYFSHLSCIVFRSVFDSYNNPVVLNVRSQWTHCGAVPHGTAPQRTAMQRVRCERSFRPTVVSHKLNNRSASLHNTPLAGVGRATFSLVC